MDVAFNKVKYFALALITTAIVVLAFISPDTAFNIFAAGVHVCALVTGLLVLHIYAPLLQGISTAKTFNPTLFFCNYTHRRLWILAITMPVSLYCLPFNALSFWVVENNQTLDILIIKLLFGLVALAYHLDAIQDRRRRT
jgi:hypothetical protein